MVKRTRRRRHHRKHSNSRRAKGMSLSKESKESEESEYINTIRKWCIEFNKHVMQHEKLLGDLTNDTESLCTSTLTNNSLNTFKIKCLASVKHLKENIGTLERKLYKI